MTTTTLVDVGSVSKQFTAAAILKLESEAKLRETDSLGALLDSVPPDKRSITIRQLLTHTAGIAQPYGPRANLPYDAVLKRILGAPLKFPPGSRQAYSNAGYVLLAAVIERVSGQPFRKFIADSLFKPAGMTHTGFRGMYPAPMTADSVAKGYDELGMVDDPALWNANNWADLGASQVVTSAGDLAKWFEAMTGDRILPKPYSQHFFQPLTPDSGSLGGYGYGLQIQQTQRGTTIIHHGGDASAYGANVAWYPKEGALIIGVCNVREDLYPTRIVADEVIPKIIFGDAFVSPPAFQSSPKENEDRLTGSFRLPSGDILVVYLDHGTLRLGAEGQEAIDELAGGDSTARAHRWKLNNRTQELVDSWFRGDTLPLSRALGPGGDAVDFGRAMQTEMTEAAHAQPVLSRALLGTYPGGGPYGAEVSLVRLRSETETATYRIKWDEGDVIWDSSPKAARAAVAIALQPAGAGEFVGWDLSHARGVRVKFVGQKGRYDTLLLWHDGLQSSARRIGTTGTTTRRSPS